MFVRHPLIRLRSAYLNKIRGGNLDYTKVVHNIAIFSRGPGLHNVTVKPITFSEFVTWYFDKFSKRKRLDVHWEPIYSYCRPCEIEYDFIGHQETFEEDVSYILRNVIQTNLTFAQLFDLEQDRLSTDKVKVKEDMARNTSYRQLSNKTLERLITFLNDDFRLFGYLPDIAKLPWFFSYGWYWF